MLAKPTMSRLAQRLLHDTSGVSVIEFAIVTPFILSIALYGIELAYFNSVDMKMSEIALSLADNASRIGQTDNSVITPTVSETDINEVMRGAQEQAAGLEFQTRGRVILSSLERDGASGKQYIHWQRCYGNLDRESAYGNDGDRNGLTGEVLAGMGNGPTQVTAATGSSVMFVEVFYEYAGLFGDMFVGDRTLHKEGAFLIRDQRNLTPGVTGNGGTYPCT
ncbi:MAG: pilus assembly protein TadE [Novosphingobium sp. 17-62-19]|uniref:TadE/TadG family type IV pilus assembly protein n=1 Tax=Novosphingobium sp. 17-62-19 TaxID=1970406 RepID=UPI000BC7CA1D|nr:pilus assembly protein TadE [Novosphingobium sp. 17-62-19]OYX95231.1 MAG: pilus assembly protein TadE [Novosphingobium sp. 35-62-5]OZA21307.1 MAG: pilus assembly protein TadE [Novosphingobium sp. 17-62-19]OZA68062.1 MAG: pilus assembly protein TadE [Sphingomonadales bacterium 39-62-4]HQS95663.1 pilus assembly protein TadE [Novosphingobium sp.]